MKASKHVFNSVSWLLIFGIALTLYIIFAIPLVPNDKDSAKAADILAHSETLEAIRADFSCAATYDNVDVDTTGKKIYLTISGEVCDLIVTLNKELEVVHVKTEEHAGMELIFAFITFAMIILLIVSVFYIVSNMHEAVVIIRKNRKDKKAVKVERLSKKSVKDQEDNILV